MIGVSSICDEVHVGMILRGSSILDDESNARLLHLSMFGCEVYHPL